MKETKSKTFERYHFLVSLKSVISELFGNFQTPAMQDVTFTKYKLEKNAAIKTPLVATPS